MPNSRRGLRVGVTGGLGSGKSTVAAMLKEKGAHVLAADEIGRSLMQPGTAVYDAIVPALRPGRSVPGPEPEPSGTRPPCLHREPRRGSQRHRPSRDHRPSRPRSTGHLRPEAHALVVVESALIFETRHSEGWRTRFDRMVLVTAPDWLKIDRFVQRSGSNDVPECVPKRAAAWTN